METKRNARALPSRNSYQGAEGAQSLRGTSGGEEAGCWLPSLLSFTTSLHISEAHEDARATMNSPSPSQHFRCNKGFWGSFEQASDGIITGHFDTIRHY